MTLRNDAMWSGGRSNLLEPPSMQPPLAEFATPGMRHKGSACRGAQQVQSQPNLANSSASVAAPKFRRGMRQSNSAACKRRHRPERYTRKRIGYKLNSSMGHHVIPVHPFAQLAYLAKPVIAVSCDRMKGPDHSAVGGCNSLQRLPRVGSTGVRPSQSRKPRSRQ